MKFTFDRDALLKEISIAQEIISTKNALSILSNVYFKAENGTLVIKATDTKVNFETRIPVDIEEPGSTTVLCDKLLNILNTLPSGDIEFRQEDINIFIKPITKKASFKLKSIASDKFPEFSSNDTIPYFEISAGEFKKMITQTVFAVSDDQTRYFMNGVSFEKKDENLIMVATDGRRLAYVAKPIVQGVDDFNQIIIPVKVLNIILKRASSEGNIFISVLDKTIFFKFGNYDLSSVLIDGAFPNYQRVIPERQEFSFEIDKKEITEALRRVALLVEQKSHRVYFEVTPGTLIISSQESEIGTAKEEIPCRYEGEEVKIALNYLYIEEPLKVIESDRICIEFTERMHAITLRPEPAEDFFHIIMPMQME